ncbi:MAG TPA: glycosyltransferase family 2 protein [Casimicrobiaceae bacterium]|nr:glycosyltransferase family 2 protein [Casimicrobiaceae bacterium]
MLIAQGCAVAVVLWRLLPGRTRRPPEQPLPTPNRETTVSVIVATLNEARRIQPCLEGLMAQVDPLLEVLVVDSRSADGTRELVEAASTRDGRIRLLTDDPLPAGWVGKVWALETGRLQARGEWILGIDADTVPAPGLVGAVIAAATRDGLDVASFSPRFEGQSPGERFVQPAMLVTLVYRCGASGATQPPSDRVLANGQCFLVRRSLLEREGGYAPARASFSDDVTLARHLATRGARVGFLDGSSIISVRSYESLGEMWREWGRSFDLKDATTPLRRWLDLLLIWLVQVAPLPLLVTCLALRGRVAPESMMLLNALMGVNVLALLLRFTTLAALKGSYANRGFPFWLSWLADLPAAIRLTISTASTPRGWRGRQYSELAPR